MPLESCMLVLDNSEYMRNGDYTPTRMQAQAEAVSAVFTAKTDSNPESAVGLMTMAGKAPSLLVTPTNDIGKLLSALAKSQIGGLSDLQTSVQIAQLALKHRENKNQRQRIVVFVGSPLNDTKESLEKLGKRLRKNNVLIDVVTFGEEGMENDEKLNALVEAAGGGESHLVSVPPGPHLLSDIIASSPILFDPERPGAGSGEDGEALNDGLDPNMDPELAMAIRMSLQEAAESAARLAPPAAAAGSSTASTAPVPPIPAEPPVETPSFPPSITEPLVNANDSGVPAVSGDSDVAPMATDAEEDEDEEEMMRRAIAMSRGENVGDDDVMMAEDEGDEEDEEAAIARAIAMSLGEAKEDENSEKK